MTIMKSWLKHRNLPWFCAGGTLITSVEEFRFPRGWLWLGCTPFQQQLLLGSSHFEGESLGVLFPLLLGGEKPKLNHKTEGSSVEQPLDRVSLDHIPWCWHTNVQSFKLTEGSFLQGPISWRPLIWHTPTNTHTQTHILLCFYGHVVTSSL